MTDSTTGIAPLLVGFAAETNDTIENARKKLVAKNADLIVANDVSADGAGFDIDTNIVTLVTRETDPQTLPMLSKAEVNYGSMRHAGGTPATRT